jgi:DNA-binding transcriptional ArsR family regulator
MAGNRVYEALAHPTRRRVIALLRRSDLPAGELADALDIAKPTLSGHLAVLREAGLVSGDRAGNSIIYSLNVSLLEEALTGLLDLFSVGEYRAPDGAKEETS